MDILNIIQRAEALEPGTDLYSHKYSFEEVEKIIRKIVEDLNLSGKD